MDIKNLQISWERLAGKKAFSAVLYQGGRRWDDDDFFATGEEEIKIVMRDINSLHINLSYKKALDFGCGVGRLTQALALFFDEVYGVDIASSMIDLANKYNRYPRKCQYYVNDKADLALFQDNAFDLIYTNITLQHMSTNYIKKYIEEFLRILSKQGLLIFQLPSCPAKTLKGLFMRIIPSRLLNLYRNAKYGLEMYAIKKKEMADFIMQKGASIACIKEDKSAGNNWISYIYYVKK